ncbi:YbaN family protein [Rhizobium grahamii]|uniref:YbaN family protein n=1 Tax=Rhizobium grahamii TaxID=1120045 RepID=UPI00159EBAC3
MILAAWFFGRSSPHFETYLLEHPRLGPPFRNWRESRAISPTGKALAGVGMMTGFTAFVYTQRPALWLTFLVGALISSCAIYVVGRPSGKIRSGSKRNHFQRD